LGPPANDRQIAEAGLTPITDVVSLAVAEAALKGACEKLMRGESEQSAQAEFDKWDTFIRYKTRLSCLFLGVGGGGG
jgi:hypothetical protein